MCGDASMCVPDSWLLNFSWQLFQEGAALPVLPQAIQPANLDDEFQRFTPEVVHDMCKRIIAALEVGLPPLPPTSSHFQTITFSLLCIFEHAAVTCTINSLVKAQPRELTRKNPPSSHWLCRCVCWQIRRRGT